MVAFGGSIPPLGAKFINMIPVEQQIRFLEGKIKKLENSKSLLKNHKMQNIITDQEIIHLSDLLILMKSICNAKALRFGECEVCGAFYLVKREKQAVCSGKCRTKLHRMKKQEVNHD